MSAGKQHLNKWDDFRTRRDAIVQRYLALKRKQKCVEKLIATIKMVNGVRKGHRLIRETRDYNEWKIAQGLVVLRMCAKGMHRMKKYGGLHQKHHNLLRNAFTFMASCYDNKTIKEFRDEPKFSAISKQWENGRVLSVIPSGHLQLTAGKTVCKLLKAAVMAKYFKPRMERIHKNCYFIANRIKDRSIFRLGKIVLLKVLWAQMAEKFRTMAIQMNHEKAIQLSEYIDEIPERIRDHVLKEYLRQVNLINGIYFYSNLASFSDMDIDEVECKVQIINLYRKLTENMKNARADLLTAETMKKSIFTQ